MANKLYEETAIQDIASAIREKNGGTDTYTVAQMGDAIRSISSGDSSDSEVKHKLFEGEITTTVVGSTAYADLLTDPIIAEHFNDPNLWIKVTFDLEPTAYSVKETWGFNNVGSTNAQLLQRMGQYVYRYASTANISNNEMTSAINGVGGGTTGVGRIEILEDGTVRIYSGSSSYAIRPSKYTVEVNWN